MEPTAVTNLRKSSFLNDNNNTTSDYSLTRDMRSDLTELKSILKHVQKEQSAFVCTIGNLDDSVKDIWNKIKVFDSTLPGLAVSSSLHVLKLEVDQLQVRVMENQESFRFSITQMIGDKLNQICDWFTKVEASVQTRQQRINSQIDFLARECDLSALRENVRDDFIHFQHRIDVLDKGVAVHDHLIRSIKLQNWVKTIISLWVRLDTLALKESWLAWRNMALCWRRMKEIEIIKSKTIRKLWQRTCIGAKQSAWKYWLRSTQDLRSLQKRQSEGMFLVFHAFQRSYSASLKIAFLHWHRYSAFGWQTSDSDLSMHKGIEQKNLLDDDFRQNEVKNSLRFRLIISALKGDNEGALLAITKEVCEIRSAGMVKLWEEMKNGEESLRIGFERKLESIKIYFQELVSSTNDRIFNHSATTDQAFVEVKAHVQAMKDRIYVLINEALQLGMKHSETIQRLAEETQDCISRGKAADDNLEKIHTTLFMFDEKTAKLEAANRQLSEKLSESEQKAIFMTKNFEKEISILQTKVSALLKQSNDHTYKLGLWDDALTDLKHDQMKVRMNMDERFDQLQQDMNAYGVRKPNIEPIVDDCLLYESLSKEKNYAVAISHINTEGAEVNLADHIASFAHDYADWIAFRVDHEVLQCIIVGRNPEDLVYANDECAEKRSFLLAKLRSKLETTLEEASPGAGSQRLEARVKFINRVMEAIETALSKYDQVLVPMSARLSKMKASVPTCMACDRPLRIKERNNVPMSVPKVQTNRSTTSVKNDLISTDSIEGKANALSCILSTARGPSPDCLADTNYVMRGGFKMPLGRSSNTPLL